MAQSNEWIHPLNMMNLNHSHSYVNGSSAFVGARTRCLGPADTTIHPEGPMYCLWVEGGAPHVMLVG